MVRRSWSFALVLCLIGLTAPARAASDTSPPRLLGATISSSAVSVGGFGWVPVTIRLHLTDATGVQPVANFNGVVGDNSPAAVLTRTSVGRGQVWSWPWDGAPGLHLTSGTPQDGWWSETFPVTAGYDGTFALTRVVAYDQAFNYLTTDPRAQGIHVSLTVHGSKIPHLVLRQTPDPVKVPAALTLYGQVTYADTGALVPSVTLHVGNDTECVEGHLGRQAGVTTNAAGAWRLPLPYYSSHGCAYIYNRLTTPHGLNDIRPIYVGLGFTHFHLDLRFWVTARVTSTPIRLGQSTSIVGASNSEPGSRLLLQHLAGTSWTTVATTTTRASGRYTFNVGPTSRGNHRYRVACNRYSVSPTVVVGVS